MPAFSFTLQLSLIDVPRIYNSLDFTQKDINSIERYYRYKSAKFLIPIIIKIQERTISLKLLYSIDRKHFA